MRILSFPEQEVPPHLRTQALALQAHAWPSDPGDPPDGTPDHDPLLRPLSVLLVADDGATLLASLDILTKEITHRDRRYTASGLSRVVTDSRQRGRGHGRLLVASARATIAQLGSDLDVFTCDTPLQGFYESAGWKLLPGTYLVGGTPEDPFPSLLFDKVTMAAFFSPTAQQHATEFHRTRIELHPGTIDRLW